MCVCAALKLTLQIFRSTVKWPDFEFESASSIFAETMSVFFKLYFCITYVTQTTHTAKNTRAVQGAYYNQLASTRYALAAHQQSRKKCHPCAEVCPRCIALLPILYLLFHRALRSVELGASAVVWYMHASTGIRALLLLLLPRSAIFVCSQVSVVQSSGPFFGALVSSPLNPISHLYCAEFRVSRVWAVCAVCHAWSAFNPSFLVGSPWFFRRERHNKDNY